MKNRNIRTAVIGCGRVMNHYESIIKSNKFSGIDFVGFCDKDIQKAKKFAGTFQALAFKGLREMLDNTNTELLMVLTPSGLHYKHSKIGLEQGCHVITEKPITLLPTHAIELKELAEKRGRMYGVVFQNRFNPSIKFLSNAIQQGRFGKIITSSIRLRWCRFQGYYEDEWHGTWKNDGGVINQQAIHHIDALNWLCGPVDRVHAFSANRLNVLEAEDSLVATLEFTDGSLGTIEATTAARPEDFEASLSIVGEGGYVEIGGIALNELKEWQFIDSRKEDKTAKNKYSQKVETGYGVSHGPFFESIINTLRENKIEPPVSASDGLETLRLIHALYSSVETNSAVDIKDNPISRYLGK